MSQLLCSKVNNCIKKNIGEDQIKKYPWSTQVYKEHMWNLPLMPREVCPDPTAVRACSICTSLPEGL